MSAQLDAMPRTLSSYEARDGWTMELRPDHDLPFFYEVAARRKLGVGDDWKFYRIEKVDSDTSRVTGAVPVGVAKNGRPKWPAVSQSQTTYVSDALVAECRVDYERETGKCCDCGGAGWRVVGSSASGARKYADCRRCSATGKAVQS